MLLLQYLFNSVVELYLLVIIIGVIVSWLVAFNVVNPYNQLVSIVLNITQALTEPILKHIRRFVPPVGGLDLSLIVLFIGVRAISFAVNVYIFAPLIGAGIR